MRYILLLSAFGVAVSAGLVSAATSSEVAEALLANAPVTPALDRNGNGALDVGDLVEPGVRRDSVEGVSSLVLTAGSATVAPGEIFTIPVTVDSPTGVAAASVNVEYDTSKLAFISVGRGAGVPVSWQFRTNVIAMPAFRQQVRVVTYPEPTSLLPGPSGELVLMTFQVTGLSAGQSTSLELPAVPQSGLSDSGGSSIPHSENDGLVTMGTVPAELTVISAD